MEQEQLITARAIAITGGDPTAGQGKISGYGCGGCHQIPGVQQANGKVGLSLKGIASRAYLAGELKNTRQNLMQ